MTKRLGLMALVAMSTVVSATSAHANVVTEWYRVPSPPPFTNGTNPGEWRPTAPRKYALCVHLSRNDQAVHLR